MRGAPCADHGGCMELLAAAGLVIVLALLAAVPLVLLLNFGGRPPDGDG